MPTPTTICTLLQKVFTCEEEPQKKEMNITYVCVKNKKLKARLGRLANYANKQCSVCNVPLCTKKNRFPNVRKTCWELWHTEADLVNGLRERTLCHVKNPREELCVETTTPPVRAAPACTKQGQQSEKRETERLNGCWLRVTTYEEKY